MRSTRRSIWRFGQSVSATILFLLLTLTTTMVARAADDARTMGAALRLTAPYRHDLRARVEGVLPAEVFSSIRVVKAFAREDYEQRRLENQSLSFAKLVSI